MKAKQIYFAGPLFNLADRTFNRLLADAIGRLEPNLRIELPQDFDGNTKPGPNWKKETYQKCLDAVDACDAVLAILDGPDADSGTCIELGYAKARNKPIVGVRTDSRELEDRGVNLMVSHICTTLLRHSGPQATVDQLAAEIVKSFRAI